MSAPTCPDLKALFGDRYKVTHDPVCEPDPAQPHVQPESKNDPWLYQIPCRYGVIYPHGRDTLALEFDYRTPTTKKVLAIPGEELR
jgi:hypothetical protein